MAFADAFDIQFIINYDPKNITGRHGSIAILTCSMLLFDVLEKVIRTIERRLMIYLKIVTN